MNCDWGHFSMTKAAHTGPVSVLLRDDVNCMAAVTDYRTQSTDGNDTDRGKPKHSEKNLSQFHLVHHKSHIN